MSTLYAAWSVIAHRVHLLHLPQIAWQWYCVAFGSLIALYCVVVIHQALERVPRESVIHQHDPPLSSLLPWDRLTPHETGTILYNRCPDCMHGSLIPGPWADAGKNVACGSCGDEFYHLRVGDGVISP